MKLTKGLAAAAIALALAACETASDEKAALSGAAGGAGSVPTTAGSSVSGYGAGGAGGMGGVDQRALGGSAAAVARQLVTIGDTVYFAFDSYAIEGEAQTILDKQAALLLQNAGVNVVVEGHTDERGTREYNLALGERRATAVKDYLVAYGIAPGRVRTISYGKERPAVVGSTEAAWAKNRRAVTVVSGAAVAGS